MYVAEQAARHPGIVYLRTTRQETPILYDDGGLGEVVRSALAGEPTPVFSLAVRRLPRSGTPAELLEYEGISAAAIVQQVNACLSPGER